MKEVAILLLVTLMLNGCGSSSKTVQTAAGGVWSADLPGGSGSASGFSFTTQFTVNGDGSLQIAFFQFLTAGGCFPVSGGSENGSMDLTVNTSSNAVTGTFNYVVTSGNNSLTLNGTVTGTESGTTLSGGSIVGTWVLAGDSGCNAVNGSFTMTQIS